MTIPPDPRFDPLRSALSSAFAATPPSHTFSPSTPVMLPSLIGVSPRPGTRFALYSHREAPQDPLRLGLLFELCGYDVRNGLRFEVRGCSGLWALAPNGAPSEPVLRLLRRLTWLDWPARAMNPDDDRFDLVFAPGRRSGDQESPSCT